MIQTHLKLRANTMPKNLLRSSTIQMDGVQITGGLSSGIVLAENQVLRRWFGRERVKSQRKTLAPQSSGRPNAPPGQ